MTEALERLYADVGGVASVPIVPHIQRSASHPTPGEKTEEVDAIALAILAAHRSHR